jgi:hypothetical protein
MKRKGRLKCKKIRRKEPKVKGVNGKNKGIRNVKNLLIVNHEIKNSLYNLKYY